MRVIVHNAISLDGKNTGFDIDLETYYGLIEQFGEDITLWGSGTVLQARMEEDPDEPFTVPDPQPGDNKTAVAVLDSRGKINCWKAIIDAGYWNKFYCLVSESTHERYISKLEEIGVQVIVCGKHKVDLELALETLENEYGHKVCRLDSGGTLNGLMLDLELVDEVSLMVCPVISDGMGESFAITKKMHNFKLKEGRPLKNGLVWLRYER